MTAFRPCALIPTYDNPATIAKVVERVRAHLPDVLVVDDGSHEPAARLIDALERDGHAHVARRARNGGKGAAVKTGFEAARELGYTHALQVDADGQHDLDRIPAFLAAARQRPDGLVLGQPVFDATVPRARLRGRQISVFWARVETFGDVVGDPLCGFRVYPLEAAIAARARGDRMDFDPEIVVRMAWAGVPVLRLPIRVRYLTPAEGGVSHFQGVRDNVRISCMHTCLVIEACLRQVFGRMHVLPAARAEEEAPP